MDRKCCKLRQFFEKNEKVREKKESMIIIPNFFKNLGKKIDNKISKKETGDFSMKDFTTYLSTAPVLTLLSVTVVAGLLIEINRFFPDALIAAF